MGIGMFVARTFFRIFLHLSTDYLSVDLSIYRCICSIHLSNYLSVYTSTYLPVYLCIDLPSYLSVDSSIYRSVYRLPILEISQRSRHTYATTRSRRALPHVYPAHTRCVYNERGSCASNYNGTYSNDAPHYSVSAEYSAWPWARPSAT